MGKLLSPQSPKSQAIQLGKVLLLSSGETSPSGHKMHEHLFAALAPPIRVAILETPAGFELNSDMVAQRVADFLKNSLRNFSPEVSVIPARRSNGLLSTNNPEILAPMLNANHIYMGAGSPTYLVRHMKDSLAWRYLLGRHRQGATLCLASAAAVAFGAKALPVYEIFKAGHDLGWIDGLDFFGLFGLDLAIVSHWDNREGGPDLDTSHCFMGRSRMECLRKLLPPATRILGIDEYTGVEFDFQSEQCTVLGKGRAVILSPGVMEEFSSGSVFPIQRLGAYHLPPEVPAYGPPVLSKDEAREEQGEAPKEVLDLIQKREAARKAHNWTEADAIRRRLDEMGFEVHDTKKGAQVHHKGMH